MARITSDCTFSFKSEQARNVTLDLHGPMTLVQLAPLMQESTCFYFVNLKHDKSRHLPFSYKTNALRGQGTPWLLEICSRDLKVQTLPKSTSNYGANYMHCPQTSSVLLHPAEIHSEEKQEFQDFSVASTLDCQGQPAPTCSHHLEDYRLNQENRRVHLVFLKRGWIFENFYKLCQQPFFRIPISGRKLYSGRMKRKKSWLEEAQVWLPTPGVTRCDLYWPLYSLICQVPN